MIVRSLEKTQNNGLAIIVAHTQFKDQLSKKFVVKVETFTLFSEFIALFSKM